MYAIGEAARLSGVGIETIRYYEREGLIAPAPRGANGRRVFAPDAVAELALIRRCRDLGFGLADIRALLDLTRGQPDCAAARAVAQRHLDRIRDQIVHLRRLERVLAELAAGCDGQEAGCALLDALQGPAGRA